MRAISAESLRFFAPCANAASCGGASSAGRSAGQARVLMVRALAGNQARGSRPTGRPPDQQEARARRVSRTSVRARARGRALALSGDTEIPARRGQSGPTRKGGGLTEILLDTKQLVVLRHTIRRAGAPAFI